jgi:hypothetical protein
VIAELTGFMLAARFETGYAPRQTESELMKQEENSIAYAGKWAKKGLLTAEHLGECSKMVQTGLSYLDRAYEKQHKVEVNRVVAQLESGEKEGKALDLKESLEALTVLNEGAKLEVGNQAELEAFLEQKAPQLGELSRQAIASSINELLTPEIENQVKPQESDKQIMEPELTF